MAEPTTLPSFSTTATYTAPGEPWDGDQTKVDPGAPIRALGFEPDLLPAPWLNFIIALWGDWLTWFRSWHRSSDEEFIYPSTKTRKRTIDASDAIYSADGAGATDWYLSHSSGVPYLVPRVDAGTAYLPIDVPSGSTISAVEVLVQSSGARSTPNGWIVKVYEQSEPWSSPGAATATQQGSTTEGGLSSGHAVITVGSLTPFIRVNEYTATIQITGPTGALGSTDQLIAARVTFTDGGPRNA